MSKTKKRGTGKYWFLILLVVGGTLVMAPPAKSCSHFNPLCWVEEAIDIIQDLLEGVAMLVLDIITLNPEEFFEDLTEIAEDLIFCDGLGIPEVTYVEFLIWQQGAKTAQHLFDDCDAATEIEPAVRTQLENYYRSDFSKVRIHQNCDFDLDGGRLAITFGENIYFKTGQYYPTCSGSSCSCRNGFDVDGFALLAHELMHVLQYRNEGFKDFICKYSIECGAGALIDLGCSFEQQAYIYQALVLEDMKRDGDGVFTCPLGECDNDVQEWNGGNIDEHSCVAEIQLCGLQLGDPSAPDYCTANDNCPNVYNPGQEDSDGDGRGDGCDVDCPSDPDPLPVEDLDNDCVFDIADNCACPTSIVELLTDCDNSNDPPSTAGGCLPSSGCQDFANPGQEDFDSDGMGDLCDPDDDNDQLSDDDEATLGTDPFDPDTDDDGLTDGEEVHVHGTNPLDSDSDDDGLSDGDEILVHGTDPLDADTDDDYLPDGVEVGTETDPVDPDSDDDGLLDGQDVEFLQNAIEDVPQSAFLDAGGGLQNSMLVLLDTAEGRLAAGLSARRLLGTLRSRVDGCGTGPDRNDWIIDCTYQVEIRTLLDLLIQNLPPEREAVKVEDVKADRADVNLNGIVR